MSMLFFQVEDRYDNMKIGAFLRKKGLSARTVTLLKKDGNGIYLNGINVHTDKRISKDDIIKIEIIEDSKHYEPSEVPLNIIYEDDNYLIVNKPSDMTMYPNFSGKVSLLNCFAGYLGEMNDKCVFRPYYRLDRDTSGIVVIGKNRFLFDDCKIEKTYYGVCTGIVTGDGTIDSPIGLEEGSIVKRECGHGQKAVTYYSPIKTNGMYTYLYFRLSTGRTHQIRVHMSSIGHPLAGDDLYGGSLDLIRRQALFCGKVIVSSEMIGFKREFTIDVPEDIITAFPSIIT
jgi:23S rRNA pseudouridine1911/1915/1917 synthase